MKEIEPTIKMLEERKKLFPSLRYWLEGVRGGVGVVSSLHPNIPQLNERVKDSNARERTAKTR